MKSYPGEFLIATVFLLLITYTQTIAQSPWIPDPNFGISGVTRVDFAPSYSDFPNDILFQPDNKILTAGKSEGSEGYFISLSQLLSNGQPDVAGFGLDGEVMLHFVLRDHANDIERQPDGKILVAGSEAIGNGASQITASLYRFNSDGTLDTSFADSGKAIHRLSPIQASQFYRIKVLSDGRIWAIGGGSPDAGFGAMRFLQNGHLDQNFGSGGIANLHLNDLGYHPVGSLFLSDTAVVMVSVIWSSAKYVLVMMDSSGTLHPEFGNNGIVFTNITGHLFAGRESLALTSDGKILLGCTTPNSSPTNFTVIRFLIDGTIDSTFGTNGRADIQFTSSDDILYDLKLDKDGKILLVGKAGSGNGVPGLMRLTADGIPDTTFAPDGKFIIDLNNNSGTHYFTACLPLQNGDILAAGYDFASNSGDFMIVKLTQNPTGVDYQDFIEPNDFVLHQNYPNPFNPTTKISWQSPVNSWQTLKVFDILGNEVATLVNEFKAAGSYEVNWITAALPSGVYCYRFKAGDFVQTRKMVLLK